MERDGNRVVVAVRKGSICATITLHYRGSAALGVLMREASADDGEFSAECDLNGDIETNERIAPIIPRRKRA